MFQLRIREVWTIYIDYLDRDRIKRCVTKMRMSITGAWAGKQLPVVPRTEGLIWEDLFEGHNWTIGVMLLITVGVGLLSCVCIVFDPHLVTENVSVIREPEVERNPSGMTLESVKMRLEFSHQCHIFVIRVETTTR